MEGTDSPISLRSYTIRIHCRGVGVDNFLYVASVTTKAAQPIRETVNSIGQVYGRALSGWSRRC